MFGAQTVRILKREMVSSNGPLKGNDGILGKVSKAEVGGWSELGIETSRSSTSSPHGLEKALPDHPCAPADPAQATHTAAGRCLCLQVCCTPAQGAGPSCPMHTAPARTRRHVKAEPNAQPPAPQSRPRDLGLCRHLIFIGESFASVEQFFFLNLTIKLKHFQTVLLFEEANNYLYANSYFFFEQPKFIVHTKQVQLVSRPFFLLFFFNCYYFYFELGYYNDML